MSDGDLVALPRAQAQLCDGLYDYVSLKSHGTTHLSKDCWVRLCREIIRVLPSFDHVSRREQLRIYDTLLGGDKARIVHRGDTPWLLDALALKWFSALPSHQRRHESKLIEKLAATMRSTKTEAAPRSRLVHWSLVITLHRYGLSPPEKVFTHRVGTLDHVNFAHDDAASLRRAHHEYRKATAVIKSFRRPTSPDVVHVELSRTYPSPRKASPATDDVDLRNCQSPRAASPPMCDADQCGPLVESISEGIMSASNDASRASTRPCSPLRDLVQDEIQVKAPL